MKFRPFGQNPLPGHRLWAGLLLSAASLAGVMAIGTDARAQETYVSVPHSGLKQLDPIFTTAYISRDHGYMIYDTLVAMNSKGEISGQMAQSWEKSADGLRWTFTLRPGLKFHDGSPVRPQDVIASIKRWGSRDAFGRNLMGVVSSIEPSGSGKFIINLTEPYNLVLEALAKPSSNVMFVMKESSIQGDPEGQKAVETHIGSGPFVFSQEDFRPGNRVLYKKNKDYTPVSGSIDWGSGGKQVNVDQVEWLVMPDSQTAVNALIEGEIDFIEAVPTDLRPLLEDEDDVTVTVRNKLGFASVMLLNHLHPPFNNKKVRQAVRDIVTQKPVLQAMVGGEEYYRLCPAMFGCGMPLETNAGAPSGLTGGVSLDEAKKTVAASGYDGTEVLFMHPTDLAILSTQPVVIGRRMREAGMKVDIQTMDWQTVVGRRAKKEPVAEGGWNSFVTAWSVPDIFSPLSNQMVSGAGLKAFFGWPDVPKAEEIRKKFSKATSLDEQKKLAAELQRVAYDEVMYIPLGQYLTLSAWRKNVKGIQGGPLITYWGIRK